MSFKSVKELLVPLVFQMSPRYEKSLTVVFRVLHHLSLEGIFCHSPGKGAQEQIDEQGTDAETGPHNATSVATERQHAMDVWSFSGCPRLAGGQHEQRPGVAWNATDNVQLSGGHQIAGGSFGGKPSYFPDNPLPYLNSFNPASSL